MSITAQQKYGNHPVDQKGRRRAMRRTPAELALDKRYRERFSRLTVESPEGKAPSRAIAEISEGRQAPWRPNARRVLELMDAGFAPDAIKAVINEEMDRWIDEQAAARGLRPAA
jgi:hypothetical protein